MRWTPLVASLLVACPHAAAQPPPHACAGALGTLSLDLNEDGSPEVVRIERSVHVGPEPSPGPLCAGDIVRLESIGTRRWLAALREPAGPVSHLVVDASARGFVGTRFRAAESHAIEPPSSYASFAWACGAFAVAWPGADTPIRVSVSASCPVQVEWSRDLDGDGTRDLVRAGLDELHIAGHRVAAPLAAGCAEVAVGVVDLRRRDGRREVEHVCFSGDDDGRSTRFFAWIRGAIVASPVLRARPRPPDGSGWVQTTRSHCGVTERERWVLRRGRLRFRGRWREGRYDADACVG